MYHTVQQYSLTAEESGIYTVVQYSIVYHTPVPHSTKSGIPIILYSQAVPQVVATQSCGDTKAVEFAPNFINLRESRFIQMYSRSCWGLVEIAVCRNLHQVLAMAAYSSVQDSMILLFGSSDDRAVRVLHLLVK